MSSVTRLIYLVEFFMTGLDLRAGFARAAHGVHHNNLDAPDRIYSHNLDASDTGSYCGSRLGEKCCVGRNDHCSVPFFDTLCYCDIFCDRKGSDCCPDFSNVCEDTADKFSIHKHRDSDDRDMNSGRRGGKHHRDHGSSHRDDGSGRRDDGSGHSDHGSGRLDHGSGHRDDGSGRRDDGSGHRDDGSGRRDDGSGHRDHGSGRLDHGSGHRDDGSGRRDDGSGRREHGSSEHLRNQRQDTGGRDLHARAGNRNSVSQAGEEDEDWELDAGANDWEEGEYEDLTSHDGHSPAAKNTADNTRYNLKNNCYHQGRLYEPDDEIKENCNNCTCVYAVLTEELNWKCTQKICLIRAELLDHVTSSNVRWAAQNYSQFWGLSVEEGVQFMLGTHQPSEQVSKMSMLKVTVTDQLPDEFDAREHWPGLISPILNQEHCSASWAFSTASVASDRLRIHSGGVYGDVTLSPQQLISCNHEEGAQGCKAGHVDKAWWFLRKVGLVSNQCYPFTSSNPEDTDGGSAEPCWLPKSYQSLKSGTCPNKQVSQLQVFQATPPYKIAANEREIMKEIIDNGPLQAVMEVKEDFFMYKSGVYQHSLPAEYHSMNQRKSKYHSVKLLGWGTDASSGNPLKYWLCANSWGESWGEKGYFRILRGTDECSIESSVIGVWIKVNERMLVNQAGRRKLPNAQIKGGNKDNNNYLY